MQTEMLQAFLRLGTAARKIVNAVDMVSKPGEGVTFTPDHAEIRELRHALNQIKEIAWRRNGRRYDA